MKKIYLFAEYIPRGSSRRILMKNISNIPLPVRNILKSSTSAMALLNIRNVINNMNSQAIKVLN